MADISMINKINWVIANFFDKNPHINKIKAKELMPDFMQAGIFTSNHRDGLPLRNLLRELDRNNQLNKIPSLLAERKTKNTNWFFIRTNVNIQLPSPSKPINETHSKTKKTSKKRKDSDEHYVIDLCDYVLKQKAIRQHRFDFLLGDLYKDGINRAKLPVDAYYKDLNLVVEYAERQHTELVPHFDKPDIMTISGVSRGEQRKIYDQRRLELIPKNGIDLILISYSDFNYNSQKKIIRKKETDLKTVREILKIYSDLE